MSSSKRAARDAAWLQHKVAIERMIFQENRSLLETRQKLEEDGFLVTKAQLEYKLKVWGLRKRLPKNTSAEAWQYDDEHLVRRELQSKSSEVIMGGSLMAPAKVDKERRRYQRDILKRMSDRSKNLIPPPGSYISVCTPPPLSLRFSWSPELPWLRSKPMIAKAFTPFNVSPGELQITHQSPQALRQSLMTLLDSSDTALARSVSRLPAGLGSIMPEAEEDEHINRAQLILQGSINEALFHCIMLLLCQVSNNMDVDTIWVFDILIRSGFTRTPLPLRHTADPTIKSIAGKLFQCSMEALEYGDDSWKPVITWLLSSGQSPNTPFLDYNWSNTDRLTPLQYAIKIKRYDVALQLLDAGADPKLCYEEKDSPLLGLFGILVETYYFDMEKDEENKIMNLVKRLLDAGDSLNEGPEDEGESVLMLAVGTGSLGLVDMLIQSCGANVLHLSPKRHRTWSLGLDTAIANSKGLSPLHLGAYYGHLDTCKWLLSHGAVVNPPERSGQPPSPAYFAALENYHSIVELLFRHGADMSIGFMASECKKYNCISFRKYFPFLTLENKQNRQSSTDIFINLMGATIIGAEDDRTYRYLAGNGARLPKWAVYYGACFPQDLGLVRFALAENADPNWRGPNGRTPLQAALTIEHESLKGLSTQRSICVKVATELLSAGATLVGGEAQQAIFLGDWGLVENILRQSPKAICHQHDSMSILEAALLSKSNEMIQHVLTLESHAYDSNALCAGVLLAISEGRTDILGQILRNREPSQDSLPFEGLAELITAGEDVDETKSLIPLGRSPLQKATDDGNLAMFDILVKVGANVNGPAAKNHGATALQLAAIKGRLGLAKRLIDLGANVNASRAEKGGRTAIEGAAEHGRIDMIAFLLDQGVQTTGDGRLQYLRAIKFAEGQGHLTAASLLRNHREWTFHDNHLWDKLNGLPE
ncbi:ankyrin repeat containing protein [Colletotrichum incanum]|uniref:Ankyrin repeat containing protein n=1 Tax=Colletotrichum incanum TaxID=1573173 RepID=A0A161Y0D5_COLIC|nr:ankyrin repeat containing protein [Colletotrichum incanum]